MKPSKAAVRIATSLCEQYGLWESEIVDVANLIDKEFAQLLAVSVKGLQEWESWIHDQLDGTTTLSSSLEKVDAERAKIQEFTPEAP